MRVAQRELILFIAGEGFEDVGAAGGAHERGKEAVERRGGNEETFRQLLRKRETIEIRNSALHHEGQTHCVLEMPLSNEKIQRQGLEA